MQSLDLNKYISARAHVPERTSKSRSFSEVLSADIQLLEKKFGPKQKEAFYNELGLLLSTGVDIKSALDIIKEDFKDKKHRVLIEELSCRIVAGQSINEALLTYPQVFSKYEVQSVRIGEDSGRLPEVLKELGVFYESGIRLRRQVIGVLTYPAVVIGMALVIVFFMLSFVVPVFTEIFKQSGGKLPDITLFLIRLSDKSGILFNSLFGFIGLLYLLHSSQKKKEWYRHYSSAFLLKVPVLGVLIQKIYLARFCLSMKLLAGAKVRMNEALDLVRNMIDYYPLEKSLEIVMREVVEEGKLLNESLAAHSIFPKKLVALIKLSEEVNEPELIYTKLHAQYSQEIEHQQAVLGKLIEPFFIVILGLFVGFILVAMYLPMFEMSTNTF